MLYNGQRRRRTAGIIRMLLVCFVFFQQDQTASGMHIIYINLFKVWGTIHVSLILNGRRAAAVLSQHKNEFGCNIIRHA